MGAAVLALQKARNNGILDQGGNGGGFQLFAADDLLEVGIKLRMAAIAQQAGNDVQLVEVFVRARAQRLNIIVEAGEAFGLGAQGATPADLRAVFGAALPQVLPNASRSILATGPDVSALRAAAREESERLAEMLAS